MTQSPFAPTKFPDLPPIAGIDMAVAATGLRYKGRDDLWVMRGQPGTQVAGVFTKNLMPGAPVTWSRRALLMPDNPQSPKLLIVNAGNSNVFTGSAGEKAVELKADVAERVFAADKNAVLLASTGVIGEVLDPSKIVRALPDMAPEMKAGGWKDGANAILTTDTYAKGATAETRIGDIPVRINGIAKGSGMIAPDMATMLAFIGTDAKISQSALQSILSGFTELTFNAITVDSDTSTSDTVLIFASGAADHAEISSPHDPALGDFKNALLRVMLNLAHQIIKDGEGASKFIAVNVSGAVSDDSGRKIAMSIANSPLVKTAIAGEDANWGRIVMAVGKSGEPADPQKLSVSLGPYLLAHQGQLAPEYEEKNGAKYMKRDHLEINVDIGLGSGSYTAWTCDLTHRYIDINADYRS